MAINKRAPSNETSDAPAAAAASKSVHLITASLATRITFTIMATFFLVFRPIDIPGQGSALD